MTTYQHEFVKDWIKAQTKILRNVFPDKKKEEIVSYLEEQVQKNLVNHDVKLHNNYRQQSLNTTLLDVIDWIKEKQPICAGFGMFYKNQHKASNPNSRMIINFLDLRKSFKKLLKEYLEGTYEYNTADRKQMTEKVNVNAFYGCNGAPRSRFYNLYTAASVTLTGQSLLSTTAQALEAFLANNVPFHSLDECFEFMEHVRKDDVNTVIEDMEDMTVDQVFSRIRDTFFAYNPEYDNILTQYLISMEQDVLNRLYYKNNLYEFCRIPSISAHFIDMIERTDSFMSPAHIPEEIAEDMDILWAKLKDWVFHNHSPYNRINRLRTHIRKAVVLCDTDSKLLEGYTAMCS